MTGMESHTFGFLLRSLIPLVLSPADPAQSGNVRLRGVVQSGESRARIAFSRDAEMREGVGFDFPLEIQGEPLPVDSAIDWMRADGIASFDNRAKLHGVTTDSHRNSYVDGIQAGFLPSATPSYDHTLFGVLSILVHGGGFPWFEDVFTCSGFMLRPASKVRLYLRLTEKATVWGVDVPLVNARTHAPVGLGVLPQELHSLLSDGQSLPAPTVDESDDYCSEIFDMTDWLNVR